eukprot:TRINITY_DN22314_c0_g1_i1.p1 TRINITY_DN22314_c0_g1~~TRINITY_DN22314_c0_g1_i1.p1  ORF type:complete len:196 (+),score=30.18 TRINITY_DN22314_c0_g1_i1:21-608(+)
MAEAKQRKAAKRMFSVFGGSHKPGDNDKRPNSNETWKQYEERSVRERKQLIEDTDKLLSAEELTPSASAMYSAARYITAKCFKQNEAYTACKMDSELDSPCLNEGFAVNSCVNEVFSTIQQFCAPQFNALSDCVARSTDTWSCRGEEPQHTGRWRQIFIGDMEEPNYQAELARCMIPHLTPEELIIIRKFPNHSE